nr:hypothetical protein [Enterobacter roggenkampii]
MTVTLPSAPVVPVAAARTAPLVAVKATAAPDTGLPLASVTTACTLLAAVPSATAPSSIRSSSATRAVVASATNCTSAVCEVPLWAAVTVLAPARVLVRVTVTVPSAPVVPVAAARTAPLVAVKATAAPDTGLS